MSGNKLHPIHVALESQQFTKAIKLCLAQPASNTFAQALLAHAYAKSGQRFKSLLTLQGILGKEFFPELQLQIRYSMERRDQNDVATVKPSAPTPPPGRKSGKKGKKKGTTAAPAPAAVPVASTTEEEEWDVISQFDIAPTLPDDWDCLPPPRLAITDDQLLQTLSMTIRSTLQLPLTNYQLYCWTASNSEASPVYTSKAFLAGFPVLVSPHYEYLTSSILANMQVLALQWSRFQQSFYGLAPATAWAAQTALWQLEYSNGSGEGGSDDEKERQRLLVLPRLAESLASKCIQDKGDEEDSLILTENFLLYLRTLDLQFKWDDKLKALDDRMSTSDALVYPPRSTLLDLKADTLQKLCRYTEAIELIENELLSTYPDNWSYWKRHMACALGECNDNVEGLERTAEVIARITADVQDQKYPLRGPNLMKTEILSERVRRQCQDNSESGANPDLMASFLQSILDYGTAFAPRASCTFEDLDPYVDLFLTTASDDDVLRLLVWLECLGVAPRSTDVKERRKELRVYTFCTQMMFKIVEKKTLQRSSLPTHSILLRVWKDFHAYDPVNDENQKENRPADELILFAVQHLLQSDVSESKLIQAAAILETGISYSPHNAHLKLAAMNVYSRLNAADLCWVIFQSIFLKHIQYESCAYLVLPLLRSGALYEETIVVCKEILRLQRTFVQEAGDFAGKAMEHGSLSKADEFLRFQRKHMNRSLTTLEAKGLILDAAPLFGQTESPGNVGAFHGIIGSAESDVARAKQIVNEAHNPFASFSLLRVHGNATDVCKIFQENRDFSVIPNERIRAFDVCTSEAIVGESIRRGHLHGLLIRASLCIEMAKAPKKGKVVTASPSLKKRCSSLLTAVAIAQVDFCQYSTSAPCYGRLMEVFLFECRLIAAVTTGQIDGSLSIEDDSLDARETHVTSILDKILTELQECGEELLSSIEPKLSFASRILPECLIPVFAVLQMCADVFDLNGWGRRKRKTKRCSGLLADVAIELGRLVGSLHSLCGASLPRTSIADAPGMAELLTAGLLAPIVVSETYETVMEAQAMSRRRLGNILSELKTRLDAFDVQV